MAVDFQVVYPTALIHLNQIRFKKVGSLMSLDIEGDDFRAVDEVLINDMLSPDVIVVSRTRLLAQLPDVLQRTRDITSVAVTSNRLTLTSKSLLRFKIGNTPGRVSGVMRLMQVFLKLLLTTPGSDIFRKRVGGAGLRPLGQTYGGDEGRNIIHGFTIAVDTTAQQLVGIQGRSTRTPRDELLLSARVTSASFDRAQGAIIASIELISQAGRAATASLEL